MLAGGIPHIWGTWALILSGVFMALETPSFRGPQSRFGGVNRQRKESTPHVLGSPWPPLFLSPSHLTPLLLCLKQGPLCSFLHSAFAMAEAVISNPPMLLSLSGVPVFSPLASCKLFPESSVHNANQITLSLHRKPTSRAQHSNGTCHSLLWQQS